MDKDTLLMEKCNNEKQMEVLKLRENKELKMSSLGERLFTYSDFHYLCARVNMNGYELFTYLYT